MHTQQKKKIWRAPRRRSPHVVACIRRHTFSKVCFLWIVFCGLFLGGKSHVVCIRRHTLSNGFFLIVFWWKNLRIWLRASSTNSQKWLFFVTLFWRKSPHVAACTRPVHILKSILYTAFVRVNVLGHWLLRIVFWQNVDSLSPSYPTCSPGTADTLGRQRPCCRSLDWFSFKFSLGLV